MATNLTTLFTNIANAIRAKTGSSEQIVAENFPTAIAGIETTSKPIFTVVTLGSDGTFTIPSNLNRDRVYGFFLATSPPLENGNICYAKLNNLGEVDGMFGHYNGSTINFSNNVKGVKYNKDTGIISIIDSRFTYRTNSEFVVITG